MRPRTETKITSQDGKTTLNVTFPKGIYDVGCLAIDSSFQQLTDDLRSTLKDCIRQVFIRGHSTFILGIADFECEIRWKNEEFFEYNERLSKILDNPDLRHEDFDIYAALNALEPENTAKPKEIRSLQTDMEKHYEYARTMQFLEDILAFLTHSGDPCKSCGRASWPILFRDPSSPGRRGLSHQMCPTCEIKHRRSQTLDRVRKHRNNTPKKRGKKPKRRRSPV